MLTISQTKKVEEIEIGVLETERVNITEDEMLSMLLGAGDVQSATELVASAEKA